METRVGPITFEIPQARGTSFYPSALERGVRSERALKLAIAEMYVQGVSTRKVTEVMRELCGLDVSSAQVSRAATLLDEELSAWRNRPLGEYRYLFLDARYEKVRHGGAVVSCAVLIAAGIDPSGHRSLLGVSVSLSEADVHWRAFLASLQERGLYGGQLVGHRLVSFSMNSLFTKRKQTWPAGSTRRASLRSGGSQLNLQKGCYRNQMARAGLLDQVSITADFV